MALWNEHQTQRSCQRESPGALSEQGVARPSWQGDRERHRIPGLGCSSRSLSRQSPSVMLTPSGSSRWRCCCHFTFWSLLCCDDCPSSTSSSIPSATESLYYLSWASSGKPCSWSPSTGPFRMAPFTYLHTLPHLLLTSQLQPFGHYIVFQYVTESHLVHLHPEEILVHAVMNKSVLHTGFCVKTAFIFGSRNATAGLYGESLVLQQAKEHSPKWKAHLAFPAAEDNKAYYHFAWLWSHRCWQKLKDDKRKNIPFSELWPTKSLDMRSFRGSKLAVHAGDTWRVLWVSGQGWGESLPLRTRVVEDPSCHCFSVHAPNAGGAPTHAGLLTPISPQSKLSFW